MKYNNNEKWSLLHDKYRLYMKGQKDGVLPNAWMAATPENKLKGYLLNASHPTGKHKAKVIESVLGYNEKNWEKFSDKLYAEVQKSPVVAVNSFTYNRNGDLIKAIKYEVPVIMSGENHRMLKMKTIWQIDDGVKNHRFITASFYKKGK